MLTKTALTTLTLLLAGCASTISQNSATHAFPAMLAAEPATSPDEALHLLTDGNARYVAEHPLHAGSHAARRAEVATEQHPIAVVVCCSDSRVGPEIIFDQDLGDIFVVRTAGNVIGDIELGTIEYAVDHLHTPLILVAGHERCGAVSAAVQGGHAPGHLPALLNPIAPAVEKTKGQPGDHVDNAVRENVRQVVAQLAAAGPILAEQVKAGKLKVVGARYDLDTGKVEVVQ